MSRVSREGYESLGIDPDVAMLHQSQLVAKMAEVALYATMDLEGALSHAEDEIKPPEGKVYTILLDNPEFSFLKYPSEPDNWVPRNINVPDLTYFFADRIVTKKPTDGSGVAWTQVFAFSPDGLHRLTLSGDSMIDIQESTEVAHDRMINHHLAKFLEQNEERLAKEDVGF